ETLTRCATIRHQGAFVGMRLGGRMLERLFTHHRSPYSHGKAAGDFNQLGVAYLRALVHLQVSARFRKGHAVANHQCFEADRYRTKAPRLGRRSPFTPLMIAEVEVEPLDNDGEERWEAAAPLEFPEDLVVPVDQLQLHLRGEVFDIRD